MAIESLTLDENGGMKTLQKRLLHGANEAAYAFAENKGFQPIFREWDSKEAFEKYCHLVPPVFYSQLKDWYAIPKSRRPQNPSLNPKKKKGEESNTKPPGSPPKVSATTTDSGSAPSAAAITITTRPALPIADRPRLQEELDTVNSANATLRKRIVELESPRSTL